jgi:octaprenyl-diphosphate synthase
MAFQIKDDLFDYESINQTGKPTGIDIQERKMTLPLIYTLQHVSNDVKKRIINIIKNDNTDKKKVAEVLVHVKESGGIAYAEAKMLDYINKALHSLEQIPSSVYKDSFIQLIHFTINRQV